MLATAVLACLSPWMTTDDIIACALSLWVPPVGTAVFWWLWFRADHKRHMARRKRENEAWEAQMKDRAWLDKFEQFFTVDYTSGLLTEKPAPSRYFQPKPIVVTGTTQWENDALNRSISDAYNAAIENSLSTSPNHPAVKPADVNEFPGKVEKVL